MNKNKTATLYDKLSLWIDWLTVAAIFVVYFAAIKGSPLAPYHLALGPIIGAYLIFRTGYRIRNGRLRIDTEGDEAPSQITLIRGLLVVIPLLTISRLLLTWANQLPVQVFGLEFDSPWLFTERMSKLISIIH